MAARTRKPTKRQARDARALRQLLQATGGAPSSGYGRLPKPILDFLTTATEPQLQAFLTLVLARWEEVGEDVRMPK